MVYHFNRIKVATQKLALDYLQKSGSGTLRYDLLNIHDLIKGNLQNSSFAKFFFHLRAGPKPSKN